MLIMTAKVDKRKILIGLAVIAALIIALVAVFGGSEPTASIQTSSAAAADTNDARVKFLTDLGWDVTVSPTESMQVRIPRDSSDVFERYNALQKSQGYDLSKYAGKTVMRYVYQINNYPGATEPVYATLLVYKDQIIGGDITDTAPGGKVQGFAKSQATPSESSQPKS